MKLSIIIPTSNRIRQLEQCIQSIINQKILPWEILVIDNLSKSSSRKVKTLITSLQSTTIIKLKYLHEPNTGVSFCRNIGIIKSISDVLAFLDDDCVVYSNWSEEIIKSLQQNKNSIVAGKIAYKKSMNALALVQYFRSKRIFLDTIYQKDNKYFCEFIDTKNFALKKKLLKKYHLYFDTRSKFSRFSACEDLDLSYRAKKCNVPIFYSEQIIVHHQHLNNLVALLKREFAKGRAFYYFKQKWPTYNLNKSKLQFFFEMMKDRFLQDKSFSIKVKTWLLFVIVGLIYKTGNLYEKFVGVNINNAKGSTK